jgi:hypothetical protein
MSNKMTKRQYEQTVANLRSSKAMLEAERDELIAKFEAGEAVDGDEINVLHDAIDDVEQELRDADFGWRTRTWDAVDWATRDLIAANID